MKYKIDKKGNIILENGKVIPASKRQKTEVYSRVVGYLRQVSNWNKGKQAEFKKRKVFKAEE
jgi:anaerobic ribonucleoside-triphosphate reductase